ncbi:hypothetical protein V5O48_015060, partial [Marasmius crinis-equi]
EIVVGRQLDRLVSKFRHNYVNFERDRTGNRSLNINRNDPLMWAASRYGTRPSSQYREIGVQTNEDIAPATPARPDVAEVGIQVSGLPRIGRHTQTETGEYDSIFDEPPPVLDSILEEDEPEEESGIRNEAANPDQGEPLTPRGSRKAGFKELEKKLRDERKARKKVPVISISSSSSEEPAPPRAGPSHSQHIPSTPFTAHVTSPDTSDSDFVPDDPEAYTERQARIMDYWLNVSQDQNANFLMQKALRELERSARVEQQRRRRDAPQPQAAHPEVQQIISEWKDIQRELQEGRDLRRRYEERHGKDGSHDCSPCGSRKDQDEKNKENRTATHFVRDIPPHMSKSGILQTPKHVSWASDVRDKETPLPRYTAQPSTPAPAYSVVTQTAGEIDPSTLSDTEVFVQQAHEFDSPGAGSSRDREPPFSGGQPAGVRFAENTPRVWSGRGRGWGSRGGSAHHRTSTPYPGRYAVFTPSTLRTASSPGDPGDEPPDDDEDPFQTNDPRMPPRVPPMGRGRAPRDPQFDEEAMNQATPSFIINEEDLQRQIAQMVQDSLTDQRANTTRGSPTRGEPWEERAEREARKERREAQSKIKLQDPQPFSGENREEFDPFIEECEAIYEAKPDIYADANAMINHCASWTTGKAEAAIRVMQRRRRQGHRVVQLESWGAFVSELRKSFGLRDATAFAQAKVQKTKQQPGESYGDFYNRFSEVATKSGFDDPSLRWHLLKGLTKPTLARLRGSNNIPSSYTDLHEHLRELDAVDHTLMEGELIDSYDVEVATMPSTAKKTISTTTTTMTSPRAQGNRQQDTPRPARQYQPPNRANPQPYFNSRSNPRSDAATSGEVKKAVTGLPDAAKKAIADAQPLPWPTREIRDQRRRDKLCLLCGDPNHFVPNCPHNQRIARGAVTFSEAADTDSVWVTEPDGMGHLVYYDDFLDDEDYDNQENGDEAQDNLNSEA